MSTAGSRSIRRASIACGLPCRIEASSIAASRLFAAPIGVDVAGEVEVEVLHRNDLGEPTARRAALDPEHRAERGLAQAEDAGFLPIAPRPSVRPTEVVVLPSPALVGVIPVTQTSLPSGVLAESRSMTPSDDLRLVAPVGLDLLGLESRFARRSRRSARARAPGRSRGCSSSLRSFHSINVRLPPPRARRQAVVVEALERERRDQLRACGRSRPARPASCRRSAPP